MNNSLLKTAKDLNRCFNKEDIPMANTYIKMLKSFIIIELQTKTRYHYITIRIAKTQKTKKKKSENTNCFWGYRAIGILIYCY